MRGTLVTENEEECFRLNSSPYAGGEQQGVEGEDGNANQQADYKRSRYKQQQRRRPRPQVGGGAASVADLFALCSASLDGQRYLFKISASADNDNECMKFDDDSFLIFTENVVFVVSLRVSCPFMGLLLSFFSPYAWFASRTKLSLYGQCLLLISVVNRVNLNQLNENKKRENPTIQYPMSNDQRIRMQFAIYEMIILTEYQPNLLGFFWYFLKSCQDEHVDNYGENADRGCYQRLF
ncbi:hypothetical protein T01_4811 [Trichinella spiralis]|uniref:Uncharacterized protein n=1 Tax=Trichinella spiralis TaxID=6334 RepID=A0A0V1BKW2_TRISP|nr:hypothetical protein T01_4811 [Trichinella spiralis]